MLSNPRAPTPLVRSPNAAPGIEAAVFDRAKDEELGVKGLKPIVD